jgi:hypothetical protein
VRTLFTYFMVSVLLACPHFCRATDDGCCAIGEAPNDFEGEKQPPVSCDDSASCICGGAIKAADHLNNDLGSTSPSPSPGPFLAGCILPHHFSLALRIARRGAPPQEDGWRLSRGVQALFQNVRC